MGVIAGLLRRFAATVIVVVAVTFAVFVATEALPGDAATALLGSNASPERVASVRYRLGLDLPVTERYVRWLGSAATGDLGTTIGGQSVSARLRSPFRNSAILFAGAFIGASLIAIGGAMAASRRPGTGTDRRISTTSLIVVSVPEYVVAAALVSVFGVWLGMVPTVSLVPPGGSPLDQPAILIIPVLTLSVVAGSFGLRLARAVLADAGSQPHVEAARLAGLAWWQVAIFHWLPTAAGPLASVLGLLVPFLVGGAVITERVTGYPGMGSLLVDAITVRDVRVVEAVVLVLTVSVVGALALADAVARAALRSQGLTRR